jgi:hypothetical protein
MMLDDQKLFSCTATELGLSHGYNFALVSLGFILSYQAFLFVWLNFQPDKSENTKGKCLTQGLSSPSNRLIGMHQTGTETGVFTTHQQLAGAVVTFHPILPVESTRL